MMTLDPISPESGSQHPSPSIYKSVMRGHWSELLEVIVIEEVTPAPRDTNLSLTIHTHHKTTGLIVRNIREANTNMSF